MSLTEQLTGPLLPLWREAAALSLILFSLTGLVAIIAIVSHWLRRIFRTDPSVRFVYKASIYVLTMTGVLILLAAALVGFLVPVIPGSLLLLLAFLLLRRVYRNAWLEQKIRYLTWRFHLRETVRHAKQKVVEKVRHK